MAIKYIINRTITAAVTFLFYMSLKKKISKPLTPLERWPNPFDDSLNAFAHHSY